MLPPRAAQPSLPAVTLQFASISRDLRRLGAGGAGVLLPGPGTGGRHRGPGRRFAALLAGIAVVLGGVIVFGGNLIANVLYGVIDPRVRRGEVSARAEAKSPHVHATGAQPPLHRRMRQATFLHVTRFGRARSATSP